MLIQFIVCRWKIVRTSAERDLRIEIKPHGMHYNAVRVYALQKCPPGLETILPPTI